MRVELNLVDHQLWYDLVCYDVAKEKQITDIGGIKLRIKFKDSIIVTSSMNQLRACLHVIHKIVNIGYHTIHYSTQQYYIDLQNKTYYKCQPKYVQF